ncbi:ABC transporter ATP-binding protein [Nonomuraea sp. NPDC002799]
MSVRPASAQQVPATPSGSGEPPADFGRTALRLLGLLRPFRRLWGVAALGFASIVLNVCGPLLLGHATNLIFSGAIGQQFAPEATKADVVERLRQQGESVLVSLIGSVDFRPGQGIDFRALGLTLVAAFTVHVASGMFWILQGRHATGVVQHTVFRLRRDAAGKLGRLPVSYFDRRPRGEVLSRTTNDIDNVAQCMQQTLSQITNSSLLLLGVLAMMFWLSPLLAMVALVAIPLSILMTRVVGKRAQRQFARQWKATGELNAHVEEAYTAHDLVKVYGRERESAAAFAVRNEQLSRSAARAQFISGVIGPATTLIGNLSYVLIAVIGGLRLIAGGLSIGAVQAFVQYSRQFTQPLMGLANLSNLVQSGVASAERVFAFLDAEEEPPSAARPAVVGEVRGRVAFESVSFRYDPDQPLIEDFSLTVEPGATVAIVGPTGAGKTTLVDLLLRFYEVTAGRITVDGVDIRDMDRDDLRSAIGMVPQEAWLFGGTIRENIAYGRPGAVSDEEISAAARVAHVDHLVRTLSQGYDAVIDDEGSGVSGGERQMITIARAIVANPAILVLDEATSSVDTRTELLVQQAMARAGQGRTSFVIAHRLSTIRDADLILMMGHGTIVEQGTHEELLAAKGPYARMYAAQFRQPLVAAD